jgi:hypothetical protein
MCAHHGSRPARGGVAIGEAFEARSSCGRSRRRRPEATRLPVARHAGDRCGDSPARRSARSPCERRRVGARAAAEANSPNWSRPSGWSPHPLVENRAHSAVQRPPQRTGSLNTARRIGMERPAPKPSLYDRAGTIRHLDALRARQLVDAFRRPVVFDGAVEVHGHGQRHGQDLGHGQDLVRLIELIASQGEVALRNRVGLSDGPA